jgi:PAS domain S-box-containing protein
VLISIVFSFFSLSLDFISTVHEYYPPYAPAPISKLIMDIIFLWLLVTLGITYQRWREALSKQKELEDIISSINADVLVVVDRGHNIVMCNDSVKSMFGYSVDEVVKGKLDLLCSGSYARLSSKNEIYEKLEKEGFYVSEALGRKKNGDVIPLEIITYNRKNHSGTVLLLRDITNRKRLEQQLIQSEKLNSLGELAGGVAHDFNNVLAAIIGRAQLLKMHLEPLTGRDENRTTVLELKKGLELIESAARDGAETVKQIQEFSRRRTDDKDFTAIDINELLDHALEYTRLRWKDEAESKGIRISIIKELSPLHPIRGRSSELRRVFTNLINNALDAMPRGGEIRVNSFMNDSIVVIKIEDTGDGIPRTIKDKIFDPFFTTKGPQSTGLGLSVCYGTINRHRGTITAESVEGEGSTFILTFPAAENATEGEVRKENIIPIRKEQEKARILVIDDEESVRELLRDILTDASHEVEVAGDGKEGIALFRDKEFDMVFTDLGMPVMSGWEVAEKVKSINEKVPIALITGWNVSLEASELNDKRINLVIQKPFKIEEILHLVQEGMILRDQFKAV